MIPAREPLKLTQDLMEAAEETAVEVVVVVEAVAGVGDLTL